MLLLLLFYMCLLFVVASGVLNRVVFFFSDDACWLCGCPKMCVLVFMFMCRFMLLFVEGVCPVQG